MFSPNLKQNPSTEDAQEEKERKYSVDKVAKNTKLLLSTSSGGEKLAMAGHAERQVCQKNVGGSRDLHLGYGFQKVALDGLKYRSVVNVVKKFL